MTTELEKKFFNTFGIVPKTELRFMCVYDNRPQIRNCQKPKSECENCRDFLKHTIYPQITDSVLLQLLEVLLKFLYVGIKKGTDFYEIDIQGWIGTKGKTLQEAVLQMFINIAKTDFKEVVTADVQAIFEGER